MGKETFSTKNLSQDKPKEMYRRLVTLDKKLFLGTAIVLFYPLYYFGVGLTNSSFYFIMPMVLLSQFPVLIFLVVISIKANLVSRLYYLGLKVLLVLSFFYCWTWFQEGFHIHIKNTLTEKEWNEIAFEYKKQYALLERPDSMYQYDRRRRIDYKESKLIRDSLLAKTPLAKIAYFEKLFGNDSTFKICTGGAMVGYRGVEISLYDTIEITDQDIGLNSQMKVFFHPGD